MAMVNSQAPRQACLDWHTCSVRGPQSNAPLMVPVYETRSHYSDASEAAEHGIDLRAARNPACLPDDRSLAIQHDHGRRTNDV